MKGLKYDEGKPLLGMMQRYFARAIDTVGRVATVGANKYGRDNWLELDNAEERYHDALYRHLNAMERGEELDEESGYEHLAHAAWNALALLELKKRKDGTN